MKKMTLQLLAATLVAIAISFSSCSKEGPVGPQGEQGAQGPQGAKGDKGDKGDAGTANVIYSAWTDTAKWLPDTVHNGSVVDTISFTAIIKAPQLSLDILNMGMVKVYADFNGDDTDPTVVALPYLGGSFYVDAIFYLNTIQLTSNIKFEGLPIRYVLVPGETAAGRKSSQVIDWNDYNAVKKYLNLKD